MTRLPYIIWEQAASPPTQPPCTIVQLRLSGGAKVHDHLKHDSSGRPHSPPQTTGRSVQPFLHGRYHIFTLHCAALSPTNLPYTVGAHLIHISFGSADPITRPKTHLDRLSRFFLNTRSLPTNKWTDRHADKTTTELSAGRPNNEQSSHRPYAMSCRAARPNNSTKR